MSGDGRFGHMRLAIDSPSDCFDQFAGGHEGVRRQLTTMPIIEQVNGV